MKKFRLFLAGILVLGLGLLTLGGCRTATTAHLEVVTSTSLLAQIVERVGGNLVSVVNIIPPAQCPGHFDVKPGDIQKLADAGLFLLHGWQGEQFSAELVASANNPDLTVVPVNIPGNWMVPSVQIQAVDTILAALSDVDSENAATYQEAAAAYKASVTAKEAEIEARLAGLNLPSINVMCSNQLTDFVQWLGLNVVADFGRPEDLTPQVVQGLVDTGRTGKVTLIIDNLQSGEDAGKGLAEELGCQRVVFTNFPGGFDNTETWEKALDYDVGLVLGAIAQ